MEETGSDGQTSTWSIKPSEKKRKETVRDINEKKFRV